MTTPPLRRLTVLSLFALSLVFAGCPGPKRPPVLSGEGGSTTETKPETSNEGGWTSPATQPIDEGPDVRAVEAEGATGTDLAASAAGGDSEGGPLADVRFEYDSAQLTDAARSTLEKHAAWLQSHREVNVTVEGHCDERGTVEYNLALGEQRARSTRDYLASLGVAADRLRIVSYGKERPLDPAETEEAFIKNRRAHFAVAR